MPPFAHCDLALASGLNNGTTWPNAYQGSAGLVVGMADMGLGEKLYTKNSETGSTTRTFQSPGTVAALTDAPEVIGVLSGTTNEGANIVQADLIPGNRTGQAARAQDHPDAPTVTTTGGGADINFNGSFKIYGMRFISDDDLTLGWIGSVMGRHQFEESYLAVTGSGDRFDFGANTATPHDSILTHCTLSAALGSFRFFDNHRVRICGSVLTCDANIPFSFIDFQGWAEIHDSDLSGLAASTALLDIAAMESSSFELFNCQMPSEYTLTTGSASAPYVVRNWGSADSAGLGSGDSVQVLEIHTLEGTVDIETTAVMIGGADDEASGGWSFALVPANVSSNGVGVVVERETLAVKGDGTGKELRVEIANSDPESGANLLTDSDVRLMVKAPAASGIAQYDYWPDEGAPGDGAGYTQLLGTPANIATSAAVWGPGANNTQVLVQPIDPAYTGAVQYQLVYCKPSGPTLYANLPDKIVAA